jgi:hypothetical protein
MNTIIIYHKQMSQWVYSYFLSPESVQTELVEPVQTELVEPVQTELVEPVQPIQQESEVTLTDKIFSECALLCKQYRLDIIAISILLKCYDKIPVDTGYEKKLDILSKICKFAHMHIMDFRKDSKLEFDVYDVLGKFSSEINKLRGDIDGIPVETYKKNIEYYSGLLFDSNYIESIAHAPEAELNIEFVEKISTIFNENRSSRSVKDRARSIYKLFAFACNNIEIIRRNKDLEKMIYIKLTEAQDSVSFKVMAFYYKSLMFPPCYAYCSKCYSCNCECIKR